MDTTKRSPLDRLLFATFLKGRTSSRDVWEEKGDMTPEDNQRIIEETNELAEILSRNEERRYPLFTSCCPAWVRYVENKHPQLLPYISTSKSPMEMFGAVLKEYYKPSDEECGLETFNVAIMPCTAKKMEAEREEFIRNGKPDIDAVLTTKELASMIRELGIQFADLEPTAPDTPFSIRSGGGVIFGTSGGVTEAALRRLAERTNPALQEIRYSGVRGLEGIKKFTIEIGGKAVHTAVVSGLGNAEKLIQLIESGEEHFDFVEVMACPTGCIGGAGQPESFLEDKKKRSSGLYTADKSALVKRSDENPVAIRKADTLYALLHVPASVDSIRHRSQPVIKESQVIKSPPGHVSMTGGLSFYIHCPFNYYLPSSLPFRFRYSRGPCCVSHRMPSSGNGQPGQHPRTSTGSITAT